MNVRRRPMTAFILCMMAVAALTSVSALPEVLTAASES